MQNNFERLLDEDSDNNIIEESGGYIEAFDPTLLDNVEVAINKLWKKWKAGPETKSSDIKSAKKELLSYIESKLR